jgi:integrase
MRNLRDAVDQYLTLRRSLGFKLCNTEWVLHRLLDFMEQEEATHISVELVSRWLQQPNRAQLSTWAARVGIVRRFATWHQPTDSRTEIPPPDLIPSRIHRKPPYIYTDEEVERIVVAASGLPSRTGMRALSFSTLYGLIAVTGMRISEAVGLDREDVDLRQGELTIRHAKFGKSRLVPLHASTRTVLSRYAARRDRIMPRVDTEAFFISERGARVTRSNAQGNFAKISQDIGLREPQADYLHGQGPRIHDLRHRFAVKTLIDWYRAGVDVERQLPKLATYLGHTHINDTYWYIEAVPELLQLATERLARAQCDQAGVMP